jgi:hypothetical protein
MNWKAIYRKASFYVLAYSWMVLLFVIIASCTFKIIVPNNFKTEHTFHIKMDYPTGLPFLMDTTTKVVTDTTNPWGIFLIKNADKGDK